MKSIWLPQLLFCTILAQGPNIDYDSPGPKPPLTFAQQKILDEVSWNLKLLLLKEFQNPEGLNPRVRTRSVRMAALVLPGPIRRQDEPADVAPSDDTDMKMKLFRLMYETVRDSDLKVKRAELINSYYINSSSFEIGYLMGDITDKFNVMTDISATLKRLYEAWRPIEHINAYEQIANQAIETSHLIELVRAVSKRALQEAAQAPTPDGRHKSF